MMSEDTSRDFHEPSPDEQPILLELAVDDEAPPANDSSWMGGLAGAGLSILFHAWLIFTLSGIVFEYPNRFETEPIETALDDAPVTVPEIPIETPEYELANPGDRETEVGKALNAASIGLQMI